jgi:bifunctional UDP-N-acetylglucosamine pyrophosphorylase/glucosamine-1-phosphate N-acetyltransferase
MRAGVTVVDPATTWVDAEVELAADVTLRPNVQLHGHTRVLAGAEVGPDCTLTDTVVGEGAQVVRAHCAGAEIGAGAGVGPFTYLRPGAKLGPGSKAGTYVEVKSSELGPGAKVPHLSYVGDATIGAGSNLGAGTIVANWDGLAKHRTMVGEQVRIGSNTVLVAPVTVGDGAYTAAGSAIVGEVGPGELGVSRAQQRNVEGWVAKRRAGSPSADAAERAQRNREGGDR